MTEAYILLTISLNKGSVGAPGLSEGHLWHTVVQVHTCVFLRDLNSERRHVGGGGWIPAVTSDTKKYIYLYVYMVASVINNGGSKHLWFLTFPSVAVKQLE